MAQDDQQQPNVIICGGGPAGLLAAILLNNIGIQSTVIEKMTQPDQWRSRSYTMVLNDKGKGALERGSCLEKTMDAGNERQCIYFFDGTTGDLKTIPKASPGLGVTRPLLVECLETIASEKAHITLKRGVGVSRVGDGSNGTIQVRLEDDTIVSGTHVIGADGKWSKVRQSFECFQSQVTMVTCPSFGVGMNSTFVPSGWETNGTYVVKPQDDDAMFYIIGSPLPNNSGMSVSMVCYDPIITKYPWLAPPADAKEHGDWNDEYSATHTASENNSSSELSDHLEQLFQNELPKFYEAFGKETIQTANINRRVAWLQPMQSNEEDQQEATFSTRDGRVALIGDSAHLMTPSVGEGCNTALESAVKLVDAIVSVKEENNNEETSTISCTTVSQGFLRYGSSRPKEVQPIQEMSAARSAVLSKK